MNTGYFTVTYCSAARDDGLPCGGRLAKSDAFCDAGGYWWCLAHKARGLLHNYAITHHYPLVRTPRFAIGNGHDPECWRLPLLMAREEMIAELCAETGVCI